MTTLSQDIPRMDIVIHRGVTNKYDCRWTEDRLDGNGYVPKDLTDWTATFTLTYGDTDVYTQACLTDAYGYTFVITPGDAFDDYIWKTRPLGSWRMNAFGPEGERELLGWGYYEMV